MLVSFLPFPTGLVADHIRSHEAERVAATIFGINLLLVALAVSAMWRYAIRRGLIRPDADDDEVRTITHRLTPGLAGYLGFILLGLVLPRVAVFGYLLIALILIIPIGISDMGVATRTHTLTRTHKGHECESSRSSPFRLFLAWM